MLINMLSGESCSLRDSRAVSAAEMTGLHRETLGADAAMFMYKILYSVKAVKRSFVLFGGIGYF